MALRRSLVLVATFFAAACATGSSVLPSTTPASETTTTSSIASTTTTRAPTTTTPTTTTTTIPAATTFAVIGDYGDGGEHEAATAAMVHEWAPDSIVTAGDNTYTTDGYDALVGRFYADYIGDYHGEYGPGSDVNRFFPTLGNHDYSVSSLEAYLDYFTLPGAGYPSTSGNERYYDVLLGPIHWFLLNSDGNEVDGIDADSVQADWLRSQLSMSESPWNVVVFHHAPYGSAHHFGEKVMRWPFAEWGADLVVNGHNHNYERFVVDDIPYVTVGLGWGNQPLGSNPLDPRSVFFFGGPDTGALRIEACDDALVAEFVTVTGGAIDSFSLGSGDCAG